MSGSLMIKVVALDLEAVPWAAYDQSIWNDRLAAATFRRASRPKALWNSMIGNSNPWGRRAPFGSTGGRFALCACASDQRLGASAIKT